MSSSIRTSTIFPRQDGRTGSLDFLAGGGAMGARMRALDWTQTPLGSPEGWPQSLKTIVRVMLDSRYAMWMLWGPELTFFCNDAYLPTVGNKRDWVLGSRSDKVWEEIWSDIGPRIGLVLEHGRATWDEALLLFLERRGFTEETYHTFSYSPVYDDQSRIAGMLCVVTEVTDRVISDRRLRVLRELAARPAGPGNVTDACRRLMRVLAADPIDVPFASLYLLNPVRTLHLEAHFGALPESLRPEEMVLADDSSPWPLADLSRSGEIDVAGLTGRHGLIRGALWPDPITHALVLPVRGQASPDAIGVLIAGISPRRPLDDGYRDFFDLIANQFAADIADARASEAEHRRAEALAEIDRAKTAFFSNVSHEFRTPITLMLGHLEEAETHPSASPAVRAHLTPAHRNSLRLLKLVNSLLEFSRIEAGRVQASYEPTDLAALTRDLASNFHSAIERAGLRFVVDCEPLDEPLYVDREMWEKVVLNLLSNALKFTFTGSITVRLSREKDEALLEVADTGVGVPREELPRLFERFHRIENTEARTHEGSGIGLALVQELVRLHGGTVGAVSEPGQGTAFRVRIPFGAAHLAPDRLRAARTLPSTAVGAQAYVQEALRWLPDAETSGEATTRTRMLSESPSTAMGERFASTFGCRIVLADDNTDMRAYVRDLLAQHYSIEAVADGAAALDAIRARRPDLVLTDVMMPRLDGFGVLKALRTDEALRDIPVILLSARAGEESRIEGLDAGADDYLIKPFSARELLARVGALLELTRIRREETRVREILGDVSQALVAAQLDLERVVQAATDAATELTGAAFGAFFYNVQDERGESYTLHTLSGAPREAFAQYPNPRNTGVFGPTFRGEGVVRSADITADPRYGHNEPHQGMPEGHLPVRSYLAVPVMTAAGEVIGGLFFGHPECGRFDERAERLVVAIAAQAAVAFDNARLHRAAQRELAQRKRMEIELSEADRRKDEFLAMLAHELRNPLAPIGNASEILSRMLGENPRAQVAVGMIRRQTLQLTRLVDDLLDVSRITQGRIHLRQQPADIAKVVAQAVETVEPLLREKRQELSVTASGSQQLCVNGDFARLVQCVSNVLSNAIKYTDPGGEIRIRTRAHASSAIIEIVDTGAGLPPELLPRVFDLFVQGDRTLDRAQGGLGIGLAVVKRLIEMHDGEVTARSPGPGEGSTFEIRLPLLDRAPATGTESAEVRTSSLRVLIVDDNRDSADSLAMLLDMQGHVTQAVYSGKEALDRIGPFRPDVALLDLGLPEMDGYEVARRLRAERRLDGIRIVALTGYGQTDDRERTRAAGFDDHLVKPVDLAALERALSAAKNLENAQRD